MTQDSKIKSRAMPSRKRKRRWRRRLAWLAFNLLVLLVFLYFAIPFAINQGWLDGFIQRRLSAAMEMNFRAQRFHLNGWHRLAVHGVELTDVNGEGDFRIKAQRFEAAFRVTRIFGNPLESVTVADGEVDLRVGKSKDETPSASFHWMNLPHFGAITLRNVTVRIHMDSASMIFEDVDADATDASAPSGVSRAADMNIRMKRFVWKTPQHEDAFNNVSIAARLTATRESQLATLSASLGVSDFLGASVGATLSYAAQELDSLRAQISGVNLTTFEQRFGGALPKDFEARQFTGSLDCDIEADHITERGTGEVRLKIRGKEIGATARLKGNDAQLSQATVMVEAAAQIDRGFRQMTFDVGATVLHPAVAWRDFQRQFEGAAVILGAQGRYDFDIAELSDAAAEIKLPSAVTVNVSNAHALFGEGIKYGAKLSLLCGDLSVLVADWKPLIHLRSIEASGRFALSARVEGDATQLTARGETQTDRASIRLQTFEADNAPESVLRLFYSLSELSERTTFETHVPFADAGKGTVQFSTKAEAVEVEAPLAGEMEKFSGVAARLNGTADLRGESVVFQSAKAEIADFVGAKIEASLTSKDKDTRDGLVTVADFDLKRQWAHFRRLLPDFETTYAPSGKLGVTVKYMASKETGERATVEFSGEKLTVVSSRIDLPSGIEELKLRGTADLEMSADFQRTKFSSQLTFADAVVYHDKLFRDFSGKEATVALGGVFDAGARKLSEGSFEFRAENVVTITGRKLGGDFLKRSFAGNVRLLVQDLATIFEGLVKETYQEQVPALRESRMSGALELDVTFGYGEAGFATSGIGKLRDVSAAVAGVSVDKMNGTVPLSVEFLRDNSAPKLDDTGAPDEAKGLTIRRLAVGDVAAENVTILPRVTENRLVLEPLRMKGKDDCLESDFFGGSVSVTELRTTDLFVAPRKLEAAFALQDLSAADFFKAVGLPPYHGTISSTQCRLVFTEDDLSVRGTLTAAVCGGTISLSNVRFVNYLSFAPVVELEMEFRGLNLGEVTSKLDGFGVVHGVLDGHARRVLVQQSRPYSLDLDLRTVPTKGVKQLIDRAAVRSLLILSTGERQPHVEPLLIFGGIKYRTFGIKCQINDDEVLIQGVEKRGNRHIVFDSAPLAIPQLTIEVITGRPISYDDVLARIKAAAEDAKKK
jgi:hypothetical protein